jgi:hypothetical protein
MPYIELPWPFHYVAGQGSIKAAQYKLETAVDESVKGWFRK